MALGELWSPANWPGVCLLCLYLENITVSVDHLLRSSLNVSHVVWNRFCCLVAYPLEHTVLWKLSNVPQLADHQIRHKTHEQSIWWLQMAILIFLKGLVWTLLQISICRQWFYKGPQMGSHKWYSAHSKGRVPAVWGYFKVNLTAFTGNYRTVS